METGWKCTTCAKASLCCVCEVHASFILLNPFLLPAFLPTTPPPRPQPTHTHPTMPTGKPPTTPIPPTPRRRGKLLRSFLFSTTITTVLLSLLTRTTATATPRICTRSSTAAAFVVAPYARQLSSSPPHNQQRPSVVSEDRRPSQHYRSPFDIELTLPSSRSMSNQDSNIIDGKAIAEVIRGEIKDDVAALVKASNVTPGLAVVLVGNRTDSATYVRMKIKACEEVGIHSIKIEFPTDVPEAELIAKVAELNADPKVHGILVQLPLPGHIHEQKVLDTILPDKDVDGLHPLNLAQLAHTNTHGPSRKFDLKTLSYHAACTPQGCIELIERSGVTIEGKEAVVIGRSNIVGIPVSLLLLQKNATVTIVHSRTKDAAAVVKRADIVVAAVGRAEMVKGDWIKPGAIVIDVGINSVDDPSAKKGYKLVGDVDFESAKAVAGKITPVPGGVGPMTIALLLRNTMNGARRSVAPKREEAQGASEYTL